MILIIERKILSLVRQYPWDRGQRYCPVFCFLGRIGHNNRQDVSGDISHNKNMTILSEMKDYLSPNLLWAKGHPYSKINTTSYPNQKSPFLTYTQPQKFISLYLCQTHPHPFLITPTAISFIKCMGIKLINREDGLTQKNSIKNWMNVFFGRAIAFKAPKPGSQPLPILKV